MKKIIFVIESMNVGGTESALLSMLNEIPKNKFSITVLILEKRGDFLNSIPKWIEVKFLDNYDSLKDIIFMPPRNRARYLIKSKRIFKAVKYVLDYSMWRFLGNKMHYIETQVLNRFEALEDEYDIAVSYQGPPSHFSAQYVAKKINAKTKVQWIHSDVSKLNLDIKETNEIYNFFDKIFVVSEEGRETFIKMFPKQEYKTEVFFNIISSKMIKEKSKVYRAFKDEFDVFRVLTVGRLSGEKGQKLAINTLKRLKSEGYNAKWYCVGDGPMKDIYTEMIKENRLEDDFILLGSNTNPYPYFRECDIYVQPSRFEGYCITLAEARVFNKPIVSTNFIGAREQLVNNKNGFIVEYDEESIYKAVKKLLDSQEIRDKFTYDLSRERINTENEMNKLYKLMDIGGLENESYDKHNCAYI